MEIIVEVQTQNYVFARELVCDLCNRTLVNEDYKEARMYAIFWKDRENLYLEKYICERCARFWKKKKIPFEFAPAPLRRALEHDFKRDWYGVIAGIPDGNLEMLRDPVLLKAYLYTYGEVF
ncbi:MAG: hypothetical protein QXS76_03645 [Candidatus Bathyarchaeia archaeon]